MAFGDRVASVGDNFVRFRIKSLRLQFKSILSSNTNGMLTYGILDDIVDSSNTAELPTSRDQILNLRRATENVVWRNSALSWRPLDSGKWYYVSPASVFGQEDRFVSPGSLITLISDAMGLGSANPVLGYIDCYYVIEFSGAAVTVLHSSSSSSVPPHVPQPPGSSKSPVMDYVSVPRSLLGLVR
jgi:hypothetical protein